MPYVVTVALAVVALVLGSAGAGLAAWHRRRNRVPSPYELHRARWEKTGDTAELEAMTREVDKGDK